MALPVLLLALLAPAAQAQAPSSPPIVVTSHPWAPFISPMGEPCRARTAGDDALARWFYGADRNRDGGIDADEMQADAARFFATLDADHDGEIDPGELNHYELEVAPEIQLAARTLRKPGEAEPSRKRKAVEEFNSVMGTGGALQGGARYALLNIPEPVAAADTDFDRGISLDEFRQAAARRFELLDSVRTGRLTLQELQTLREAQLETRHKGDADARVGNGLPTAD